MDLNLQIALFATFAALASALGAVLTLLRIRSSDEARFFLEMTDRYNQAEMQAALTGLALWHRSNPDDFIEKWLAELAQDHQHARDLDSFRRRVNRYFCNVAQIYQAGYIARRLASEVINYGGLNIYYEIVSPMTDARFGAQRDGYNVTLRKLRSRYGLGLRDLEAALTRTATKPL